MKPLYGPMLVALASFGIAGATLAQRVSDFTDLRVVPNPATAGGAVIFRMLWGGCTPGYGTPDVSVEESVVTVRVRYSVTCGTPLPPVAVAVPLGRFTEGRYTLRFISAPIDGIGIPIDDPPIDVPFTVVAGSGPAPSPVAAGGWLSFTALGVLLALLADGRLRSRA